MLTFPPGKSPLETQCCFVFMFLEVCLSRWSFSGHTVNVNFYMLNDEQKKGKVTGSMHNTQESTLVNHFARVIGWNLAYFGQYTCLLNLSLMLMEQYFVEKYSNIRRPKQSPSQHQIIPVRFYSPRNIPFNDSIKYYRGLMYSNQSSLSATCVQYSAQQRLYQNPRQ